MTRTTTALTCGLLFLAWGCGEGNRQPTESVDCSLESAESPYEFAPVPYYDTKQTGWFQYADATPDGIPNTLVDDPEVEGDGSNVPFANPDELPARCGDTQMMRLTARGHNFWGAGFGNWSLNTVKREDASEYEGISFWIRSAPNADKSFIFYVDDPRTIISDVTTGKDLNGDGLENGPGDIITDTECLVPPPEELGEPACYNGGVDAPSSVTREPAVNECGNAFHTVVNMTDDWQLVRIPWSALAQWPCPNRLSDGIDTARIAKFEIKLDQGTSYDFWIDNIAFYRRR